ncbi:Uncharacterised protein [Mycobacteroides abscessus subsp. abscessus]|nr:Uncharacterised protein [Mycobacteroides abscessus subsp. abscessus]
MVGPPAAIAPTGVGPPAQATNARASGVGPAVRTAASSASNSTSSLTASSALLLRTMTGNASWTAVNASSTRSCRARRWARSCATIAVTSLCPKVLSVPSLTTTRLRTPGRQ